eukprot:8634627-Pyramimonas_sp.AAC.1
MPGASEAEELTFPVHDHGGKLHHHLLYIVLNLRSSAFNHLAHISVLVARVHCRKRPAKRAIESEPYVNGCRWTYAHVTTYFSGHYATLMPTPNVIVPDYC